jgi:DNA invertase Pin-like site-specific DNA recombinase
MKAIGYVRVSSKEQGESGLGLEFQQKEIKQFCISHNIDLVKIEYEIKSAKGEFKNRQVISKILSECETDNLMLIVSSADRLSRNVWAVSNLLQQNVKLVCVDIGLPIDNSKLLLNVSKAEEEVLLISKRTKAALKVKKDKGETLGNLQSLPIAREKGLLVRKANADLFAYSIFDIIIDNIKNGESLNSIANNLNKLNVKTSRGGKWQAVSVQRVLDRVKING